MMKEKIIKEHNIWREECNHQEDDKADIEHISKPLSTKGIE